jgi:oligopeptide transport system substrate-binding protein
MRGKLPWKVAVGLTTVALISTACTSTPEAEAPKLDGSFSVSWAEPENSLIPVNTTETSGGKVIDALFTGLTSYDPKTAETVLENAESITPSEAGKVWTVKLKSGWKWDDGTPVIAKNYVDAWNYGAYTPNGMANGTFFADIAGYNDVTSEDPDKDGPQTAPKPAKDTMSGLQVVDETTFKVTLAEPSNLWPVKVGYSAFMPMPEVAFKDIKAFGEKPVGNGPFKLKSHEVNKELVITRVDDYKGNEKPKVKDVVFKVYSDDGAAYADVQGGALDFLQQVPQASLVGNKYKTDFPQTSKNSPISVSTFLAIPAFLPEYQNPKVRQAISMAIDRQLIIDKIFNGTRVPMNGWVNPAASGFKDGTCGEFCKFDAAKAKALLAEAGGFKGTQISIGYNGDASHKGWVDATCNSIETALGVKCVGIAYPTFGEFRTLVGEGKMTGMSRAGWQQDYPSIENWLNPLLKTGASSNDGQFSNAAFDAALKKADGTSDLKEAEKLYQEAEAMLKDLMPTIPLWHASQQSVWSSHLKTVVIDTVGEIQLADVEVNAS